MVQEPPPGASSYYGADRQYVQNGSSSFESGFYQQGGQQHPGQQYPSHSQGPVRQQGWYGEYGESSAPSFENEGQESHTFSRHSSRGSSSGSFAAKKVAWNQPSSNYQQKGPYNSRPRLQVCKFWENSGRCAKGKQCDFSHDTTKTTSASSYGKVKTVAVCRFFQRTGSCRDGDSCRFRHIKHTPATKNAQQPPPPTNGVSKRPAPASSSSSSASSPIAFKSAPAPAPAISSFSSSNPIACKFWAKAGSCFKGSKCKFAHASSQGRHAKPGVSKVESKRSNDTQISASNATEGIIENKETNGATVCHFFKRGHCRDGNKCKFRHAIEEAKKKPAKSKKVCGFFKTIQGCRDGDNCQYRHIGSQSSQTSKPKKKTASKTKAKKQVKAAGVGNLGIAASVVDGPPDVGMRRFSEHAAHMGVREGANEEERTPPATPAKLVPAPAPLLGRPIERKAYISLSPMSSFLLDAELD